MKNEYATLMHERSFRNAESIRAALMESERGGKCQLCKHRPGRHYFSEQLLCTACFEDESQWRSHEAIYAAHQREKGILPANE